jgi:sigma-B regulation protein RsbU (phosphoserine phosphatase)
LQFFKLIHYQELREPWCSIHIVPSYRRHYAILGILAVVTAAYLTGGAISLWDLLGHGSERARMPFSLAFGTRAISGLEPEGKDSGAKPGDQLMELGGRRVRGTVDIDDELRLHRPGEIIPAVIQRQSSGSLERISIKLATDHTFPPGVLLWITNTLLHFVLPLFCASIGFWVAFSRPFDPMAWLVLAIMLAFACILAPPSNWQDGWAVAAQLFAYFFGVNTPLWMMLFGLYFPFPVHFERRYPWIKWIIVVPLIFCSALTLLVLFFNMAAFDSFAKLPSLIRFGSVPTVLRMVAISMFFFSLGTKSRMAPTADARRRLATLWMGVGVGLFPSFLLTVQSLITGKEFGAAAPQWLLIAAVALMPLAPITLAYVVAVQRAMELRTVLRQSARYALARGGLTAFRLLLGGMVILLLARAFFTDPHARTVDRVRAVGLSLTLLVLRRKYGDRLATWMDKRFFREAYRAEQVLSELSDEARKFAETKALLATVTHRISETLHVPRIDVLLRSESGDRYCLEPVLDGNCLVRTAQTIEQLRKNERPVLVYFDDPKSWIHEAAEPEQRFWRNLEAQLLLPLPGREELLGILALGPKLSEAPYSPTDLQLLQSVANQTGFALDNTRLIATLAAEAAHRESLNREMEIAREVQERLFPQEIPAIAGVDCAGKCRPALAVGGDYYDFIALPGGKLGIAIGDISGKGISAALLMASLRASLRGQTLRGQTLAPHSGLAELMENVNQLVYEASTSNRYATFFYGQYDPVTRRLDYANAGHNPPVVLRGDEVLRLQATGPVVGLLADPPYEQACCQMLAGDIFLAFTDGISEALTIDDEEWGEERMIAAAQNCRTVPAAAMIDSLMQAADAFAAGAPQHDDMTIVIMRIGVAAQ